MTTIQLILGLFLLAITLTMIFVVCRAASLSEQAQEKALSEQTKNKTSNN